MNIKDKSRQLGIIASMTVLSLLGLVLQPLVANAASFTAASVSLSDSRSNATATSVQYTQSFTIPGTTSIKCIQIKYTTTATGSTKPTGMTTTSTTKDSFSGGGLTSGNFTLDASTDGTIKYTYATGQATTATNLTIVNGSITNPTITATFFAQISTYGNTDCSTSPVDSLTVATTTTDGVTLSITVNPSLTFAVSGIAASTTYKGAFSTSAGCTDTGTAVSWPANPSVSTNYDCAQTLTTNTNAASGYTVTVRGTVAGNDLVSGANSITDYSGGTNGTPAAWGSPTEAFGYTTSDAVLSVTGAGAARFSSDDTFATLTNTASEVAFSATPVSNDAINVGYRVRISGTTKAGAYSGTAIYTATPIF